MKKLSIVFYLIILLAMVLSFACKKYPNGPLISFRSVENRIKGSWKIIEFTSDGIDSLQYYNDSCGSTFQIWNSDVSEWESQHYRINFIYKPFYGGFTFDDKKKVMNVDFGSGKRILGPIGKGSSIWKILKLTNKKFKISTDYNGRNYIISFKQ